MSDDPFGQAGGSLPPPPDPDAGPTPPGGAWGATPTPHGPGSGLTAPQGEGPVPRRPMTVGDILDGAFRLLIANWRTLLAVMALFVIPVQLLSAYFSRDLFTLDFGGMMGGDPEAFEEFALAGGTTSVAEAVASGAVSFANVALVFPLLYGAVSVVVALSFLGRQTEPGAALRLLRGRAWPLIASWWLFSLGWGAALLGVILAGAVLIAVGTDAGVALIVVGVLVLLAGLAAVCAAYPLFALTPAVIIIEEVGPVAGLARSMRLVRPRYFRTLGIVLLTLFVYTVVSSSLSALPSLLAFVVGPLGWILVAAGSILASFVTTPFLATVLVLLYFDARMRAEGYDLALTAQQLQAPHPPVAGSA